jgi:hypothetical protein
MDKEQIKKLAQEYYKEFADGWNGKAEEHRFWQFMNLRFPNFNSEAATQTFNKLKKNGKFLKGE